MKLMHVLMTVLDASFLVSISFMPAQVKHLYFDRGPSSKHDVCSDAGVPDVIAGRGASDDNPPPPEKFQGATAEFAQQPDGGVDIWIEGTDGVPRALGRSSEQWFDSWTVLLDRAPSRETCKAIESVDGRCMGRVVVMPSYKTPVGKSEAKL